MNVRLHAEYDKCQGYGLCVDAAPSLFDLDDDGLVVVLHDEVSDDQLHQAEAGIHICPVTALRLENGTTS
jgi:ferredoxin